MCICSWLQNSELLFLSGLFCHSVAKLAVSGSLWAHGLQQARLPRPPLSPGVSSNSCPLSWWCYLKISSSAAPFAFCFQSLPGSESFPLSWLFASGGQSTRAWAFSTIPSKDIQSWFPLGLTGLISLVLKGLKSLPKHHNLKASVLWCSAFFTAQLSHLYMTTFTSSHVALTRQTCVGKVMSLLFNMLSRFVIAFLSSNKCLLMS